VTVFVEGNPLIFEDEILVTRCGELVLFDGTPKEEEGAFTTFGADIEAAGVEFEAGLISGGPLGYFCLNSPIRSQSILSLNF